MIESTFVEIINKNDKNMVVGCIYKDHRQKVTDFLDDYILPLLEKVSHKNKQSLIMESFNINSQL